jgi:hypothetical protein
LKNEMCYQLQNKNDAAITKIIKKDSVRFSLFTKTSPK